jgi:CubicO group peptidase (beta-lactamase class C family)
LLQFWHLIFCATLLNGCIPIRAMFLGRPDAKDIHRLPSSHIPKAGECFQFHADSSDTGSRIKVNDWGSGIAYFVPLSQLMASHRVRSLLVIRNDTILFEGYGQGTSASELHPSYSIAKSFTSALIGIAIDEGHIGSERDLVTDHLPELKGIAQAEHLRISHLLNMTSGIKSTLALDASIYYGNDVKRMLRGISFTNRPGTFQEYVNLNVQLLGIILKRATGLTPAEYLAKKIWQPIGMCESAIWTRDRHGENLTFCCMGATAMDYAKFGRLYLNGGSWNGKEVVPEDWVRRSLARDTTEGSSFNYHHGWHLGDAAYADFMAEGMYKQFLYVAPHKNIIIVVLCDRENVLKAERVQWRTIFKQLVDQL